MGKLTEAINHNQDDMFPIGRRKALDEIHGNVIPNLAHDGEWLKEPYRGQCLDLSSLTYLASSDIVFYCVVHRGPIKLLG